MLEIERAGGLVAGARVSSAKFGRLGPGFETGAVLPDRVRGVERMVVGFRSLEQMKLDEARHPLEMGLATGPDLFEARFGTLLHLETVHGDEHAIVLCFSCFTTEDAMDDDRRIATPVWVRFGGGLMPGCAKFALSVLNAAVLPIGTDQNERAGG